MRCPVCAGGARRCVRLISTHKIAQPLGLAHASETADDDADEEADEDSADAEDAEFDDADDDDEGASYADEEDMVFVCRRRV